MLPEPPCKTGGKAPFRAGIFTLSRLFRTSGQHPFVHIYQLYDQKMLVPGPTADLSNPTVKRVNKGIRAHPTLKLMTETWRRVWEATSWFKGPFCSKREKRS